MLYYLNVLTKIKTMNRYDRKFQKKQQNHTNPKMAIKSLVNFVTLSLTRLISLHKNDTKGSRGLFSIFDPIYVYVGGSEGLPNFDVHQCTCTFKRRHSIVFSHHVS